MPKKFDRNLSESRHSDDRRESLSWARSNNLAVTVQIGETEKTGSLFWLPAAALPHCELLKQLGDQLLGAVCLGQSADAGLAQNFVL